MTATYNPATAEPWMDDALCAQTDPDIFFPNKGDSAAPARSICKACPVIAECLLFADGQPEPMGVLGGLSARQRRTIRATRAAERRATA